MILKVKRLNTRAKIPMYMTPGAAGMDLASIESVVIEVGDRRLVRTGIAIELEPGWEAQIRPRSGLAAKRGVTVLNSPGTVDADYRGEIGVILINCGTENFQIMPGDRIAQLVVAPARQVEVVEVGELSDTERGAGGYGSTDVSR